MLRTDFDKQMERLVSFKKMDEHLLRAYWEAMQDWQQSDLAYAITIILQDDDRFPRI